METSTRRRPRRAARGRRPWWPRCRADLARQVDHVEVATVDQISLVLRDGRTVVWGSAEESELKAEVLAPLLSSPGQTYDVSVPGQPTIRP